MRRTLIIGAGAAALLGMLSASAGAHVRLVSAVPAPGRALSAPPRELRLRFDEAPIVALSKVSVLGPRGVDLVVGHPRARDRAQVVIRLRRGHRGAYTVHWQMLGDDGHVVRGAYSFGIQHPAGPPQPIPGSGPGLRSDVLRWLYFLTFSIVAGGLLFHVLILEPELRRRPESEERQRWAWKRTLIVASLASVAALHLDLYAYLDWAQQVVGGDWREFANTQITNLRTAAPTGLAWTWTTLAWLGVLGLLGAAALRPAARSHLALGAGLLALAAALGLSLTGHAASSSGPISVAVAADYIHLVAAALWLGGVASLALVAWPAGRPMADAESRMLLTSCLGRFSRLALYLVVALLLAGSYLALSRLSSPSDLLHGYGAILTVKSAFALAALGVGLYHRKALLPRLGGLGGPRQAPPTGARSLRLEAALIAAALLAAAVLTNTAPPG